MIALLGLLPREAREYPLVQLMLIAPFTLFILAVLLGVNDEPNAYTALGAAFLFLVLIFAYTAAVSYFRSEAPPDETDQAPGIVYP